MIEVVEVRPEECICEPCSYISPDWRDMRSTFGYITLYAISAQRFMKSEQLKRTKQDLEELKFLKTCSMKIDIGKKTYIIPDSNPIQEAWNQFRLTVLISQYANAIKFLPVAHPIPIIEEVDQFVLQNIIIRLATILDDKFDHEINVRNITLPRSNLFHRIDVISKAGLISNESKLNDLRNLRNNIAHDVNIPTLEWKNIYDYIDEVEKSLVALAVINKAPIFTVSEQSMSALEKSDIPGEKYRRYQIFSINGNGKPYFTYKWTYIIW